MLQLRKQLINILCILITTKQPRILANTRLIPLSQHINDMSGENMLSVASEGGDVVVPQVLNSNDDRLEREADLDVQVWDPGARADFVLEFDGVCLDHGNKEGWREGSFGEGEAMGHLTHHGDNCFVGLLGTVVTESFLVRGVDERLPGGADVCFVTVGGSFVDGEADVEVGCLVGIFVVELNVLAMSRLRRTGQRTSVKFKIWPSSASATVVFRSAGTRSSAINR